MFVYKKGEVCSIVRGHSVRGQGINHYGDSSHAGHHS